MFARDNMSEDVVYQVNAARRPTTSRRHTIPRNHRKTRADLLYEDMFNEDTSEASTNLRQARRPEGPVRRGRSDGGRLVLPRDSTSLSTISGKGNAWSKDRCGSNAHHPILILHSDDENSDTEKPFDSHDKQQPESFAGYRANTAKDHTALDVIASHSSAESTSKATLDIIPTLDRKLGTCGLSVCVDFNTKRHPGDGISGCPCGAVKQETTGVVNGVDLTLHTPKQTTHHANVDDNNNQVCSFIDLLDSRSPVSACSGLVTPPYTTTSTSFQELLNGSSKMEPLQVTIATHPHTTTTAFFLELLYDSSKTKPIQDEVTIHTIDLLPPFQGLHSASPITTPSQSADENNPVASTAGTLSSKHHTTCAGFLGDSHIREGHEKDTASYASTLEAGKGIAPAFNSSKSGNNTGSCNNRLVSRESVATPHTAHKGIITVTSKQRQTNLTRSGYVGCSKKRKSGGGHDNNVNVYKTTKRPNPVHGFTASQFVKIKPKPDTIRCSPSKGSRNDNRTRQAVSGSTTCPGVDGAVACQPHRSSQISRPHQPKPTPASLVSSHLPVTTLTPYLPSSQLPPIPVANAFVLDGRAYILLNSHNPPPSRGSTPGPFPPDPLSSGGSMNRGQPGNSLVNLNANQPSPLVALLSANNNGALVLHSIQPLACAINHSLPNSN